MERLPVEIAALSAAERLDLIDRIWDSLEPSTDLPVTEAQREELRRRLEALERGEMKTFPLEQAIAAIRSGRASHQP